MGKNKNLNLTLIGCLLLALLATAISVSLSMYTGWQLGETVTAKLVLGSVGVLAVFAAHLLLALCRPASIGIRIGAFGLWLSCIAYVVFSHANFFSLSQQQIGLRRAAEADQSFLKVESPRHLAVILDDMEKVKTELATKSQVRCSFGCVTLRTKIISLQAKLDVLNAQAGDSRRWQIRQDRHEELKKALLDDPVTSRLAKLFDVTANQVGLVTSLLFSVILEGVACLCWYVALLPHDSTVTHQDSQSATEGQEAVCCSNTAAIHILPALPGLVEELMQEVRTGQLKLTVDAIRKYCNCAQKTAADLRRQVAERLDADAQLA